MLATTSTATEITGIVAGFFLILALMLVARVIFRPTTPSARRFRVGVFVERDNQPLEEQYVDEEADTFVDERP